MSARIFVSSLGFAGSLLFALATPACSGTSGGLGASPTGFNCAVSVAGAQQCYGYSNLTSEQQSAEQTACAALKGSVVDSCPGGAVGCCATTTAGLTTSQCYYAGTASELSAGCAGTWTAGSPGGGGKGSGGSGGHEGSDSGTDGPVVSADGPHIVSLTANPMVVGPSGTTISAIVGDPKGIDALAGGTLVDPVSGQTYAAFGTPGGQGTFVYKLSWSTLNRVASIDTKPGEQLSRKVNAEFFDNQGNKTSSSLTLMLACPKSSQGACGGSCTDLDTDMNNCGACGSVCGDKGGYGFATCAAGVCTTEQESKKDESCDTVCASAGATCSASACADGELTGGGEATYGGYYQLGYSCSGVPRASYEGYAFSDVTCCCQK